MNRKRIVLVVMCFLFVSVLSYAQQFSTIFNENYPIYGFEQMGCTAVITVKDLTTKERFFNGRDHHTNGWLETKLESKIISKGICTIILVQTLNGKKVQEAQLVIQTGNYTKFNYLTEFRFIEYPDFNILEEEKYEGSEESLLRVLDDFSESMHIYYDLTWLESIFSLN
ncbi:hypothetical protein [Treponema putidum]|uniref:hypothetical protein n=1 Tax=Treponema putidum TaxID=221027 RepID=UPI003D92C636